MWLVRLVANPDYLDMALLLHISMTFANACARDRLRAVPITVDDASAGIDLNVGREPTAAKAPIKHLLQIGMFRSENNA